MLLRSLLKGLKDSKYFRTRDIIQEVNYRGIVVSIENPVGSIREGVKSDGTKWRTQFMYPYGFINGVNGEDDELLDCFIGPNIDAPTVFVIHSQVDEQFDENKIMFGFESREAARDAFLAHYDTQSRLGPITEVPFEEFKRKIEELKNV